MYMEKRMIFQKVIACPYFEFIFRTIDRTILLLFYIFISLPREHPHSLGQIDLLFMGFYICAWRYSFIIIIVLLSIAIIHHRVQ